MVQFLGMEKCPGGGGEPYTHNALIWLLRNQNRKTCVLHKPANYFILITAVFTPESSNHQVLLRNNMGTDSFIISCPFHQVLLL
jgi:hypothetical protein